MLKNYEKKQRKIIDKVIFFDSQLFYTYVSDSF